MEDLDPRFVGLGGKRGAPSRLACAEGETYIGAPGFVNSSESGQPWFKLHR